MTTYLGIVLITALVMYARQLPGHGHGYALLLLHNLSQVGRRTTRQAPIQLICSSDIIPERQALRINNLSMRERLNIERQGLEQVVALITVQ